jgi:GABA permease
MRNPFRSEQAAFRFVWLTVGYFVLIVAGAEINKWAGLGVFVVETALIAWWFSRRGEPAPALQERVVAAGGDEHRVLVVANETVAGSELLEELRRRAAAPARVLVVCPALNSPVKHWVSDEDEARAEAKARLEASLGAMRDAGIAAEGEIGDGDPLQAIEDALRTFAPDEVVISTHPPGRSHWLERGVVEAARERFLVPVTHVVVDVEADPAGRAAAGSSTEVGSSS